MTATTATIRTLADAKDNVFACEAAVAEANRDHAAINEDGDALSARQEEVLRDEGLDAAAQLDEKIQKNKRRAELAGKLVKSRETELTTAQGTLVKAEGAAHDGHVADIAGKIIKTDQEIEKGLRALVRGVSKRADAGDELIVARNGAPTLPSLRQVRGLPHLPAIITARLAEVLPRYFSRPHSALAKLKLVEHERRLLAPLLNGTPENTDTTPADAPVRE